MLKNFVRWCRMNGEGFCIGYRAALLRHKVRVHIDEVGGRDGCYWTSGTEWVYYPGRNAEMDRLAEQDAAILATVQDFNIRYGL